MCVVAPSLAYRRLSRSSCFCFLSLSLVSFALAVVVAPFSGLLLVAAPFRRNDVVLLLLLWLQPGRCTYARESNCSWPAKGQPLQQEQTKEAPLLIACVGPFPVLIDGCRGHLASLSCSFPLLEKGRFGVGYYYYYAKLSLPLRPTITPVSYTHLTLPTILRV